MLERLEIKDFALLRQADFNPGRGLIVISGETGAGKSLLLDAIGSLTGKRVNKDVIASDSERAQIEALFFDGENELLISRQIKADGRSVAHIDGHLVTIAQLKEKTQKILGIHGQHEQQQIFDAKKHGQILDNYIGDSIQALLVAWRSTLADRRQIASEIKRLGISPKQRERRLDWLEYSIQEIEEAELNPDSETSILSRIEELSNAEEYASNLIDCCNYLYAEDNDPIDQLSRAYTHLQDIADSDVEIAEIRSEFAQIIDRLRDMRSTLHNCVERVDYRPQELAELNDKLDQIAELCRKHGPKLSDVIANLAAYRAERDELVASEEVLQQKIKELKRLDRELSQISDQLHSMRIEYGISLSEKIEKAVSELGMSAVQFAVDCKLPSADEKIVNYDNGRDTVEFLISTNVGEALKPLAKIASGGEASRLLLAIKSIIADAEGLDVLIFDEIDTGISGEAAVKVARMLKLLSKDRQVLCVSHMAQVAALADEHWLIHKEVEDGKTTTHLRKLSREERTEEVTRLLAVDEAEARNLAESLLREC